MMHVWLTPTRLANSIGVIEKLLRKRLTDADVALKGGFLVFTFLMVRFLIPLVLTVFVFVVPFGSSLTIDARLASRAVL